MEIDKSKENMFIVVESGSTKADWVLVSDESKERVATVGLNPRFVDSQGISEAVKASKALEQVAERVTKIYFYGAGCATKPLKEIVRKALSSVFTQASIEVESDLLAAARATYSGTTSIACILGTGANAFWYNGQKSEQCAPSLGYVLGDEGSGSYFGKRLLADFLGNRMPAVMKMDFEKLELTKDSILENVYQKPQANRYLASFVPHLVAHRQLDYCQVMIREGFELFLERFVSCYSDSREIPINFVGSVAYFLRDELQQVCTQQGYCMGTVVQRPMDRLVGYHGKDSAERF